MGREFKQFTLSTYDIISLTDDNDDVAAGHRVFENTNGSYIWWQNPTLYYGELGLSQAQVFINRVMFKDGGFSTHHRL